MFTQEDLQKAIEAGIFSKSNDVTATPVTVIRFFETWAKEREKKIRHIAAEIAVTAQNKDSAHRAIMNINI
jgi:hypothetical protein